jgi:protein SCO1/2
VRLGDFFGSRPVILSFVYYECPMLCTQVLNGLNSALKILTFDVGKEFEIVTVSIDPSERPDLAGRKKASYIESYGRPGAAGGWHFLTGDGPEIAALTRAAGFHYVYQEEADQFAHASGVIVATPDGRLARYFYGIEYAPRDLRLGLVEAADGRIGTAVDEVLLYCFHYDPTTGKYGVAILNVIRLAGGGTALGLGAFVFLMLRRERVERRERSECHERRANTLPPSS